MLSLDHELGSCRSPHRLLFFPFFIMLVLFYTVLHIRPTLLGLVKNVLGPFA